MDADTAGPTSDVALHTEVGVTLPLVGSRADYLEGLLYPHFVERPSSFLSKSLARTATEFVGISLTEQVALQFRLGPSVWIPTESGPDTEIMAGYGARGRFESSGFAAGFGISAWTWMSESDASSDERAGQATDAGACERFEFEPSSLSEFPVLRTMEVRIPTTDRDR